MRLLPWSLALLTALAIALPVGARADQSSQPASPAAAQITAANNHSCAVTAAALRCWGFGGNGRLGYGSALAIGDDEVPGSQAPVDLGSGRSAVAISAGEGHSCALLDNGTVRCWGFGGDGRLGYGNTADIGDDESPGSIAPVDLGTGRTATAISAGDSHTCAVLDNGTVRCWGYGAAGQLGYGNNLDVGDDETPGSLAPVDIGAGATATAITAGESHTCVLLDSAAVRCWGFGAHGQLGYASADSIGDNESPASVGPVDLGNGRTATAISAGSLHTCAVLDDAKVRCWGFGANHQLGQAVPTSIGDNETPASVGPVDLGSGRTARAVAAGRQHSCAILDDGSVRCWGGGSFGQLGYGNQNTVGDDETPGAAGPVDLGPGRSAVAIATGTLHTCATLDDASVRCWGYGASGRLGYCSETSIGDTETPAAAGPVDVGAGGAGCPAAAIPAPPAGAAAPPPAPPPAPLPAAPAPAAPAADPQALENARARGLRACLRTARRRPKTLRTRARRLCLARFVRTPGRVTGLRARAISRTKVVLTFNAPGSAGSRAPAARAYLVRQSVSPRRRILARAPALCRGSCRFVSTAVGAKLSLTVTGLRPRTTYFYVVSARDNVSGKLGRRSLTVRVRTR